MMEGVLVILIVALAAGYVVRKLMKGLKQDAACGCGCSSCGMHKTCVEPEKDASQDSFRSLP
jgi:hypothetical protein